MVLRLYFALFVFSFGFSGRLDAQEEEFSAEGLMKVISKDSILTIDVTTFTQAPKVKQKVDVTKKFTMGRMQGTVGIASGQVIYFDKKTVKVQVLRYSSTVVENGVKGHLIKPGDITVIKWKDKLLPTYESEQKKAEQLAHEDKYTEAIKILDSLIKVKPQEDALTTRGYCRFSLDNYQGAIDDMTRVLATNPKGQTARFVRELSYAKMEKYDEALKDNEVLLLAEIDDKMEVRLLKDQIYIVNKMENLDKTVKKDRFCKINKRLFELDNKNIIFYNDLNYYCNTYAIAENKTNYTPLQVVSQSPNKFKLVTTALKKNKYDWYGKSMTLTRKIPVGTYVNLEEIGEGYSMTIATAKVTKSDGEHIELEIMYWGVRINNEPVMNDLSDGTTDILISW